jgi:hypothetical protein
MLSYYICFFIRRNMKRYTYIFFFFIFLAVSGNQVKAQYWDFGAFLGLSNYHGDLARFEEPNSILSETHPAIGAILRYNVSYRFAMSWGLHYATISGDHANMSVIRLKNLSFRSRIVELNYRLEYNFQRYHTRYARFNSTPFIYFGFGFFYFNPQAELDGIWYDLQPLHTEGQESEEYPNMKAYSLFQAVIPYGFGWKIALSRSWNLAVEGGIRKTFTDYLDDVSGNYADPEVIRRNSGEIAVKLADRSWEINENGEPFEYSKNRARGSALHPETGDFYHFFGITLTYSFIPDMCFRF